jgi:hypothetical protein
MGADAHQAVPIVPLLGSTRAFYLARLSLLLEPSLRYGAPACPAPAHPCAPPIAPSGCSARTCPSPTPSAHQPPVSRWEAEVEPYGMSNDFGGEAVAFVGASRSGGHTLIIPGCGNLAA